MFQQSALRKSPRRMTPKRKSLYGITYEGIPALVLFSLLGGPFQTSYLLYLGASSVQIGVVLAIPSLANVIQIVAALIMQRITNRRLAVACLVAVQRFAWLSTGLIPFLLPRDLWVAAYITMFSFAFAGGAMCSVIWTSLVADIVPSSIRGRYFGIRNMILWAVSSLCVFVGGYVMQWFPDFAGIQILYMIALVAGTVNIFMFVLYENPPFEKSAELRMGGMLAKPFQDRTFVRAMLFLSFWLFLQGIAVPMFNYVMQNVMHIAYGTISLVTVAQNVAMMAGYYIWGSLDAKYDTRKLLIWTLPFIAASCLVWGMLPVLPAVAVLLLAHALVGFGTGGLGLLMFNFTIGDTPKADRPMFIAVFQGLTGVAGFVGPVVGGYIYKEIADAPLWVQTHGLTVTVGLLMAVTMIVFAPLVTRDRGRNRKIRATS